MQTPHLQDILKLTSQISDGGKFACVYAVVVSVVMECMWIAELKELYLSIQEQMQSTAKVGCVCMYTHACIYMHACIHACTHMPTLFCPYLDLVGVVPCII